jgi:hypothetical protein
MAGQTRLLVLLLLSSYAHSFCGFFVSKAGTDLFNRASKVVMVRDKDKTVLTMANDFQGEMKDFAMVIPVPEVLQRGQINVGSNAVIDHLDTYTAPRLVEYHDENPCMRRNYRMKSMALDSMAPQVKRKSAKRRAKELGVKIEAEYTVGEYDILILSAKESGGLVTWLTENEYKIPKGAKEVVGSYLKQGMKFFVAKVNLKEQGKLGFNFLRPIQVAYSSNKFMLPIRLGMVNAKDYQDLFVFALTKTGKVETVNYKTKQLPTGMDLPVYIKKDFATFYKDMFSHQVKEDGMKSVWMEYAWDMNWCDPCAAKPLSNDELKQLGVFWLKDQSGDIGIQKTRRFMPRPQAKNVYVTRLHVRYSKDTFPDDLKFQATNDRKNFQGRYVLKHRWTGSADCKEADEYREKLPGIMSQEAANLHELTGWNLDEIRKNLPIKPSKDKKKKSGKWWDNLWS